MHKYFNLIVLTIIVSSNVYSQNNDDWLTYYEKSGFKETPVYAETVDFCKRLDKASEWVTYTTFGKSGEGRDLPLLIIDKNGYSKVKEVRQTEKLVVLIQAGIHAGEIDGKDAGLVLLRDIVINKKNTDLLNYVTILFIPILNVDGHEHFGKYNRINQNGPEEMGFRTNATNLNLNRDYLKAESPEIQAWHRLFIDWMPDFFIDIHATDGADYQYVITYHMETFGNMDANMTDWQKNVFLKYVSAKMEKDNMPVFPYVMFRKWHDPRSGLFGWVGSPVLSHGYTALQNRPSILIENHMLKDYKTRVNATINMLIYSLEIINKEAYKLRRLIVESEMYVSSKDFQKNKYTLKFKSAPDSVMVDFKGFEYQLVKSDLTDGDWFKYSNKPKLYKIPYFEKQIPDIQVFLPVAYIVPPQWTDVIKKLKLMGVEMHYLSKPTRMKVEMYRFSNVVFSEKPYECRQTVKNYNIETFVQEVEFPAGSAIIKLNQASSQVAIHALEPKAPSSFLYWGFFNSIFEQKEYAESYIMEKLARDMIASDADLKAEFEAKMKDKNFANDPYNILNWFYSKSNYWDNRINLYPVGRVMTEDILEGIEIY